MSQSLSIFSPRSRVSVVTLVFFSVFISTVGDCQEFSVLHSFCSGFTCTDDGSYPLAGVIRDASGNLYGTTSGRGAHGAGAVFKVDSLGNETLLHSFCSVSTCADGSTPVAGLVQDAAGNLYGTTQYGGASNAGTVFKVDNAGNETVLYSFCTAVNCTDGDSPQAALILDAAGNLYGTAPDGGNGGGIVFKVDSTGHETVLYAFCSKVGCEDGGIPQGPLLRDAGGNLYGTTLGGTNAEGNVFKLDSAGNETVLYNFCSVSNCADGSNPDSGVISDSEGNLYGTTSLGGANVKGTIFEIDRSGNETVLYSFCPASNCTDGSYPTAGLVIDAAGSLYGTTASGGTNLSSYGTVFKLDTAGHETVLFSFCSTSSAACPDGINPMAGLIQDASGNLYGTTSQGGDNTGGTVFEVTNATTGPPKIPSYQFIPVTPCRVADTRNPSGPFGGPEPASGSTTTFNIPQSACNIPNTAAAYSLNVTVVPSGPLNYLTLWPSGQAQPNASTLNSDGRVKANAAIVPAGVNGGVSVFVSDQTQVILDIDGYFAPAGTASSLAFYPVTPCRIADTRSGSGPLGGPSLAAASSRSFPVQSSNCNLPATAQAYSLNVTAIPHSTLNYLTTWPTGEAQPNVSTLNSSTGAVTANAAVVPSGTSGAVSVFVSDAADVILDVNGYFAPPATGGLSLYTAAPCRVIDTRPTAFNGTTVVGVEGSSCAPPSTAQAYVLNATVVPGGPLVYLTLWPDGGAQPNVSTLNADDAAITSNMAIVPTTNGSVDAFADGATNLILDFSGYFAP